MQELLLVTNQRKQWRVTAWGGVVAGLLVGVGLTSVVGFMLFDREHYAALVRETTVKAAYESKLLVAGNEIRAKERAFSGEPIAYLAQAQEANSMRLRTILTKFPIFKSDTLKEVFAELSSEVKEQAQTSQSLRQVLTSPDTSKSARCGISTNNVDSPKLWSNENVSFHKDGWRGIAQ
jgi:hypothetical protein